MTWKTKQQSDIMKCNKSAMNNTSTEDVESFCATIFEKLCWHGSPANHVVSEPCPSYSDEFDPNKVTQRRCLMNGTWEDYDEATMYKDCEISKSFRGQTAVHMIAYFITTVALLVCLFIFWYFRRTLICTRVKLHINFFISKLIANVLWVITYFAVMNSDTLGSNPVCFFLTHQVIMACYTVALAFTNVRQDGRATDAISCKRFNTWCQVLHLMTYFYMMAGYMWIFCEVLHLHISVVHVFMAHKDYMPLYYSVGWGVPGIFTLAYALYRIYHEGSIDNCWTNNTGCFLLISIPTYSSLYISLLLLVNVLRILYMKYRGIPKERSPNFCKVITAAVFMIPVFSLYFFFVPVQPATQAELEAPASVAYSITSNLMGLFLTVIFCFSHHDVINAFRAEMEKMAQRNFITMLIVDANRQMAKKDDEIQSENVHEDENEDNEENEDIKEIAELQTIVIVKHTTRCEIYYEESTAL